MCGIAGIFGIVRDREENAAVVRRMTTRLRHRGPDGKGEEAGEGWALAHARLAIMDPAGGAQPLWNEARTALIVGNNEIYNAPEIRRELERAGHRFVTGSDTEAVLHAWEEWGEDSFARLNGMFAVAIVDVIRRECWLARDSMGIKPLHLMQIDAGYAFASEIKALAEVPGARLRPNRDALHLFMNLRYVPNEQTLFAGVERLPPGSWAKLSLADDGSVKRTVGSFKPSRGVRAGLNFSEATERVAKVLEDSVSRHLISDVEVAAYLSGGLDSSLITAIASHERPNLRTFCLAFNEPTDELADARKVAKIFGTRHEERTVGASPLDHYSEVLWHVEEPKINCLQGYLLAGEASREVKVALSGLGGDELFAGYVNNDILFPMSLVVRAVGSRAGKANSLSALQDFLGPRIGADHYFRAGELAQNLRSPLAFYAILRNAFDHNPHLLNSIYQDPPAHWRGMTEQALRPYFDEENPDVLAALLDLEARTKLINDFLLTEDRVSMAHGLEVRVPFLDRELVALARSLPSDFRYRPGSKKRVLRAAAARWLPDDVLAKKKWGFSFDPVHLFPSQLGPFVRTILTRERVGEMGLFSWDWIQRVCEAPSGPRLRWHYFNLWVMAGVTLWHERFFGDGGCPAK